jgi:hypothetical protein
VAGRNSFLLRIDPEVLDAVKRWAAEELRSVNGQMEFILRRALMESGRLSPSRGGIARMDKTSAEGPTINRDEPRG